MAKTEEGDASGASKSGLKEKLAPLLKILFIVLNLGTMGGGVALVYNSTIGHKPASLLEEEVRLQYESEKEGRVQDPIVYTMEKLTVNLEGRPKRMLQTELNLEMLDDDGYEEIVRLGPEAKDEIVKLLSHKTFADLESIQGKLFLKDQIGSTLNQFLKRGVVRDVYFTELIVQ